jgi:hypothetical protein
VVHCASSLLFLQSHTAYSDVAVYGISNGGCNWACCPVLLLQVGIIRGAPLLENGVGTANTSLVFHAGRLLALHEGDLPYQVRAADSYVACLALPGHSLSP